MALEQPKIDYASGASSSLSPRAARMIGVIGLGVALGALACVAYLIGTELHVVPMWRSFHVLCHLGFFGAGAIAIGLGAFSYAECPRHNLPTLAAMSIGGFLLAYFVIELQRFSR